jgi:hypothetical protein
MTGEAIAGAANDVLAPMIAPMLIAAPTANNLSERLAMRVLLIVCPEGC